MRGSDGRRRTMGRMIALALLSTLTAGAAASTELKVVDIQIYTFDRKSGEMAPIDERAKPRDWDGDLIAIVKTGGNVPKSQLNLTVLEGKKKRLDETRAIGDSKGTYELFFTRAGMLCAETTITATVSKGKAKLSKSTTRQFGCDS